MRNATNSNQNNPSTCGFTIPAHSKILIDMHVKESIVIIVKRQTRTDWR